MVERSPPVDGRTFDELLTEARRRIPGHTPEWTDFNPSDPGVTLLELFAWLAETTIWRVDQAPDRCFDRFVSLLGLEQRAAAAAGVDLTFLPAPYADPTLALAGNRGAGALRGSPPEVPALTRVTAEASDGGETLIFETERPLALLAAGLQSIIIEAQQGAGDATLRNIGMAPGAGPDAAGGFAPFGDSAQCGDGFTLTFRERTAQEEKPFPLPARLPLRVFLPVGADRLTALPLQDCRLGWECRYQLAIAGAASGASPPPSSPSLSSPWLPLDVYADDSAGFTRDGYVELGLPRLDGGLVTELALRCRIVTGGYVAGRPPFIAGIVANTVPATNLVTAVDETLGQGAGVANQYFYLRRQPVAADTLQIMVEAYPRPSRRETAWRRVDDFLASQPRDRVFTLDARTGKVSFGDGERGAIPAAGTEIFAAYRWGGGARGNVPAGRADQVASHLSGVRGVVNYRPAVGGRDEETPEALRQRAALRIRHGERSVSRDDYAAQAVAVGGVVEAMVLALRNPACPGRVIPGCVTVVVVPDGPYGGAVNPAAAPPVPPPALLERVAAELEPRRVASAELFVVGPEWRRVTVGLRIIAHSDAAEGGVRDGCRAAVNGFLFPRLATPAGPLRFGTGFYPYELLAVVGGVAGVRAVSALTLTVDGALHDDAARPVTLPEGGLFWGGDHRIEVMYDGLADDRVFSATAGRRVGLAGG